MSTNTLPYGSHKAEREGMRQEQEYTLPSRISNDSPLQLGPTS